MRRNRALMIHEMRKDSEWPRTNDSERIERMEINNYYGGGHDDRYRDNRGREHYENGRFAPMNYQNGYRMDDRYDNRYDNRYENRYESSYDNYNDGYKRVIGFGGAEMHYDGPRRMDEMEHRKSELERGHAGYDGYTKIDRRRGEELLRKLKNGDGSTGEHWSYEQTKQVMEQKGIQCDPVEFWVSMNMMYSDYYTVAKKLNINNADFYASMAEAFLKDQDAHENKLARYYSIVAK